MARNTTERPSARERLLAAADELFYAEGVHTVGIERVIERAGVAKASLYSAFGSKDELIRAYLERRHAAWKANMERHLAACDTPRERLLAVFDAMGDVFARPTFRGCAFMNASAESPAGSPVEAPVDAYRSSVRSLFTELAAAAGAPDPEGLATDLILLYDGAVVATRLDHATDAAGSARRVAAGLIDAAIPQAAPRHRPSYQ